MTPDIIFMWVPLITFGIFALRYSKMRVMQLAAWYAGLAIAVLVWHSLELPFAVTGSVILWIVYGFVTPRLNGIAYQAVIKRDYDTAQRYENWLGILIPVPEMRTHRALSTAFAMIQQGNVAEGLALLDSIAATDGKSAAIARSQAALMRSDYQQVADIAGSAAGEKNPSIRLLGIRALAELGRLDDAIEAYRQEEPKFRAMTSVPEQALTKASLYTHAGDTAAVLNLINGPLGSFPAAEQELLMARAQYFASGDWENFSAALHRLKDKTGGAMLHRIEHWLQRGPQPRPSLGPEGREKLDQLTREQSDTRAYFRHKVDKPRVAIGLIVINLIVFLLTTGMHGTFAFYGHETAIHQLFADYVDANSDWWQYFTNLGPLGIFIWPYTAEQGEWWRLLSATFLHYNYLHVGFNMLALTWFGIGIERRVGHWRFLTIYLLSGIGSMVAALINYQFGDQSQPVLALGASGSIFGVLGAVLALAILTYRRTRLFQARQDINGILMILLIQTGFDWMYLDGSSPLHISGLVSGFIITLIIAPRSATMPSIGGKPAENVMQSDVQPSDSH